MVGSVARSHSVRARAVLVAAAVLAVTAAVVVPPSRAAAAPRTPKAPVCVAERADAAAAAVTARACGHRVEVADRRDEYRQVFADPGGTVTVEQFATPQRARNTAGAWAPIDPTLTVRADGSIGPVNTLTPVRFSAGGSGPFVTLETTGGPLSLTWPAPLPAPVLDGDSAVYANVYPDVDLRVRATGDGFTHVLVVKTRAAAAHPGVRSVAYGVTTKGVTLRDGPGGGLEAVDPAGKVTARGSVPLMWDSTETAATAATTATEARRMGAGGVEAGRSTARAAGESARKREAGLRRDGNRLTVEPDAALLTDPATTYPVYIDPDWGTGWYHWAYSSQGGYTRSTDVGRVGLNDDGSGLYRTFFRWPVSPIYGKQILGATVYTILKHSWSCSDSAISLWNTSGIANGNPTGWSPVLYQRMATTAGHAHKGSADCGNQPDDGLEFSSVDLKNIMQYAADNRWADITLGFTAHDTASAGESVQSRWKKIDPPNTRLSVTYNTIPETPDFLSVDNKGCGAGVPPIFVSTQTPTLRARALDADPDTLTVYFAAAKWNGTAYVDTTGGSQGSLGNGGIAQITPTLPGEGRYVFRAQTGDSAGGVSPVTHMPGNCEFEVDLTDPAVPTVTSGLYRDGAGACPAQGCGGVGQSDTFTFASSPDTAFYRWGFSDPPSTTVAPAALGATVSVPWTPESGGARTLYVQAVDRSGRTATRVVPFVVAGPAPALAHWRLADPAGSTVLADSSGNGRAATLRGGTLGVAGRVVRGDTAVRFSGVNTGAATAPDLLDTSKAFSVSAWVRLNEMGHNQAVASQNGARMPGFQLIFLNDCSCWRMLLAGSDTDTAANREVRAPAASTRTGVWTHLAGTFDPASKQIRLYVDGVPVGTTEFPFTPWNAGGTFDIGRSIWTGSPVDYFTGDIADVRAWNRAVSAAEVAQLHDPAAQAKVGDWTMGDVGPGPTYDASPSANDLNFWPDATIPASGAGQSGTGLRLDGVTGYAYTDARVLNTDQSFTVSAWAKLADTSTDRVVLSQDGANTSGFRLMYAKLCNCWAFTMAGADASNAIDAKVTATGAPLLDQWTRLVGVYDAVDRRMSLFVNGALVATAAGPPAPWNAAGVLAIGRGKAAGAHAGFFKGDVDEVQAYAGVTVRDSPQPVSGASADYARGATVTASASYEAGNWSKAKLTDGDRGTGWSSNDGSTVAPHTEWVELALPSARVVNRVDLYGRTDSQNFPANFTIETWTGAAWETVVSRTGYPRPAGGVGQRFTFEPRLTGKVRIQATGVSTVQLMDVEVYQSSNLAADADVTVSNSVEAYGWGSATVVDGRRGPLGWSSGDNGSVPQWVELAFPGGESRRLNRVDLYPRTDAPNAGLHFPSTFVVEVWTGTAWEPVVQRTNLPNPGAAAQRFSFAERAASRVRLRAGSFVELAEIELYRSDNLLGDAVPTASSTVEGSGWSLSNANDGQRDGVGYSSQAGSQWLDLTMPTARTLDAVTLHPRADAPNAGLNFPADFTIQVKVGGAWQTVVSRTGYPNPGGVPQRFTFDPVTATAVRVAATVPTNLQLAEVEAYLLSQAQ